MSAALLGTRAISEWLGVLKQVTTPAMAISTALLGCWQLIESAGGIDTGERTEMQLDSSGRMIYGILMKGRWRIMILSYSVDGDFIVSSQASAPGEERTRFRLLDADTVRLDHRETSSTFRRVKSCSFRVPEKKGLLERLGLKS